MVCEYPFFESDYILKYLRKVDLVTFHLLIVNNRSAKSVRAQRNPFRIQSKSFSTSTGAFAARIDLNFDGNKN